MTSNMALNTKYDQTEAFWPEKININTTITLVSVTKKVIRKVTCLIVMFLNIVLKFKLVTYAF
jgi:hypothetical protein